MRIRAFLYIVLAGIFWGSAGVFFNLLSPFGFTPLQMTAMRGTVASLVFGLYVLLFCPSRFRITLRECALFALGGLFIFGTASCYFTSIRYSCVSVAVILMYTAPVFVLVYSTLFLGEKLGKKKLFAIFLVLLGCVLVSGILSGGRAQWLGIFFGLLSGLSYSAYNIVTKIQMERRCDPVSATFYCFLFFGLISFAFSSPVLFFTRIGQDVKSLLPLVIGIGIFTCVLPYFLYTLALKTLPAGTASALGIVEPMAATLFSVVFFQETLTLSAFLGILLVLCAVVLLNRVEE